MRVMLYALYKGDEFVDVGTAEELAGKQGITVTSFKFKATPSYHRLHGTNAVKAYRIGEEPHEQLL